MLRDQFFRLFGVTASQSFKYSTMFRGRLLCSLLRFHRLAAESLYAVVQTSQQLVKYAASAAFVYKLMETRVGVAQSVGGALFCVEFLQLHDTLSHPA